MARAIPCAAARQLLGSREASSFGTTFDWRTAALAEVLAKHVPLAPNIVAIRLPLAPDANMLGAWDLAPR